MSFFNFHIAWKQWPKRCIIISILSLACVIYLYYYPVCYNWYYNLLRVYKDKAYYLKIIGSHYDNDGNIIDIIDIKMDVDIAEEYSHTLTNSNGGPFVFSEYRLPFLFTLSSTPTIYQYCSSVEYGIKDHIYYDRINKKVVFLIRNKTIEITHGGKYLVYNGVSILIDQNTTLKIHIDKDGVMSFTHIQRNKPSGMSLFEILQYKYQE